MKIIDWGRKGNVVRFFLGADDCDNYWGDDWNDAPYEHNAGGVYSEFVSGTRDIAFPYDDELLEPCDGAFNSPWSKEHMKKRLIPCLIVVPGEVVQRLTNQSWIDLTFRMALAIEDAAIQRYYFGDHMALQQLRECGHRRRDE